MNPPATALSPTDLASLEAVFGARLKTGVLLARYTSARIGGPADALLQVDSADELAYTAQWLWESGMPFLLIGGGSNILVSDTGFRGVVIVNEARKIVFHDGVEQTIPTVMVESGASLGMTARLAAQRGLSGLEWAAGIPGTVGGALFGNAGAHGADMAGNLILAEILHQDGSGQPEQWQPEKFSFGYRTSELKQAQSKDKRQPGVVVLTAQLQLSRSTSEAVQSRIDEYTAFRRKTQPPGASMGSMFKNPTDDFAGRLVDLAGLKGTRVGQAEISPLHGNFFINHGGATAKDVQALIHLAQQVVREKSGVELELEIELIGDW